MGKPKRYIKYKIVYINTEYNKTEYKNFKSLKKCLSKAKYLNVFNIWKCTTYIKKDTQWYETLPILIHGHDEIEFPCNGRKLHVIKMKHLLKHVYNE